MADIFDNVDDLREWASRLVRERVPQFIEEHEERRNAETLCESCRKGDNDEVLLLCDECGREDRVACWLAHFFNFFFVLLRSRVPHVLSASQAGGCARGGLVLSNLHRLLRY